MAKTVDTRGKKCPLPIILTKKCIDQSSVGERVEVLLDNNISKCNLTQYLDEIGVVYAEHNEGQQWSINFEVQEFGIAKGVENINCPVPAKQSTIQPYVIVVKSDQMGDGERELGELLLRSYINSLLEADSLPTTIIFYNSGVKLVQNGCDCVESLQEIENRGVEILSCGACIDYYKVEKSIGQISNMFKIANTLAKTAKIIYP